MVESWLWCMSCGVLWCVVVVLDCCLVGLVVYWMALVWILNGVCVDFWLALDGS